MLEGKTVQGNEMINPNPYSEYGTATKITGFNSQFQVTDKSSALRACKPGGCGTHHSISVKRANMAFRTASLYESAVETP